MSTEPTTTQPSPLKQAIFGFDSAWVDKEKAPGAICALLFDGQQWQLVPPVMVGFAKAVTFIETYPADVQLIALDQPSIVINKDGSRPVDKVAASVISRLKGGVQPASLSKATMFGPASPVEQRFLKPLNPVQNPFQALAKSPGRYVMEVFPALALPTFVPAFWHRQRGPKYNPANRAMFSLDDWQAVGLGMAKWAQTEGLTPLAHSFVTLAQHVNPTKDDQDQLDSMICVAIGYCWQQYGLVRSVVVGDNTTGFMVTPVNEAITQHLHHAALYPTPSKAGQPPRSLVPFNNRAAFR
jgi:predicted RNase H-like nuclease